MQPGFTLFEVILAVALVTLLLGVAVINLSDWGDLRRLDEGARRMETTLCMARADAANLGRQLRLEFVTDEVGEATMQVTWQPKPLTEPEFIQYQAGAWTEPYVPNDLVTVVRCRAGAADSPIPETDSSEPEDEILQPVTFFPDGSSDSAEIVLVSTSEKDNRRAVVEIDGLTGVVSRRILSAMDYEEQYGQ